MQLHFTTFISKCLQSLKLMSIIYQQFENLIVMCKKPLSERTKSALKDLLIAIIAAIATFVTTILTTSCGVTSARIYSSKDSAVSTITITTNNPTTVETDATGSLEINPKSK